jgi:hypothetical protein
LISNYKNFKNVKIKSTLQKDYKQMDGEKAANGAWKVIGGASSVVINGEAIAASGGILAPAK